MKKVSIIVVILLFTVKIWSQETRFEVKFSEPMAVFVFVQSLSSHYPDNPYKKLFTESIYNNEKYKALMAEYDSLNIDYSYEFFEYPYGQKFRGTTGSLLKRNLIRSASLTDFKINSVGLIPNTDLIRLTYILGEFMPVYNELVYQPNKEVFEKQLNDLSEYFTGKNITSYFKSGLTFYNSSWDNSIPFEIAFYPLPNSKGFTAEAFCSNAASAIPAGFKDYDMLMSIILHETFHILYNEQSLAVKNELDKWFNSSSSPNSTYAYLLLNEALATAMGNGYVYEHLTGKEDTTEWYDFKYINLMAKKIYPMIKEYVSGNKPIDKSFVDNYIKIYDDNFSQWPKELNHIMTYRYVLTDNSEDFYTVNRLFPYRSMSDYEDNISESAVKKMMETPITKMVLVSKDNKEFLQLIKNNCKELSAWTPDYKVDFTYTKLLSDKTFLIIINSVKDKTDMQLEALAKKGKG